MTEYTEQEQAAARALSETYIQNIPGLDNVAVPVDATERSLVTTRIVLSELDGDTSTESVIRAVRALYAQDILRQTNPKKIEAVKAELAEAEPPEMEVLQKYIDTVKVILPFVVPAKQPEPVAEAPAEPEEVPVPSKPKKAPKAKVEKVAEETPEQKEERRGRPRVYATEEEKIEARRARARERYKKKRDETAETARKYRDENPDKMKELAKKSYQTKAERLKNDPEYRAKWNEYQREYRKKRKATAESK